MMWGGIGWGGFVVGFGVRVGYLTLPYHTILLQILTNQHTFTYLPTYLNIYPTLHYHTLTYPILPLSHSHPTPTKHILNSLTKRIPYPTLPNPALPCTAVPWPAPPHPIPRPARPTWRHFWSFGTPRPIP